MEKELWSYIEKVKNDPRMHIGANTIIKSEFKIANQVIGTSVDVACDSLYILNIMIPQTIIKLKPRTKFENRISEKVFLKRLIKT